MNRTLFRLLSLGLWLPAAAAVPACSDDDDDDDTTANDDDDTTEDDDDDDDDDDDTDEPRLIPRFDDSRLRVGMAESDVSPTLRETFIDWNQDAHWGDLLTFIDANQNGRWDLDEDMLYEDNNANGQFDRDTDRIVPIEEAVDPLALRGPEPFDDADGDGEFEPVWIAGYGNGRGANAIHDPISAMATVLSFNDEYVVFVSLDLIGILAGRTRQMAANLEVDGFDPARMIVSATHTHQGPDTMGIWGATESFKGYDPEYQAYLETAVSDLVREAAANLQPAAIYGGRIRLRDYDPWVTSETFGGANPKPDRLIGLTNDIRDPIIVDDWLSVMQFRAAETDAVIGTFTNWSGHPEVVGDRNTELSADYNFYLRSRLKDLFGGATHTSSGDVGGMQSALGGWIPLFDAAGARVTEPDGEGGERPVLVRDEGWDFARSQGFLLAEAVQAVLEAHPDPLPIEDLRVQRREVLYPFENPLLYAAVASRLIDAADELLLDKELCGAPFACGPANLWYVRIEPSVHIGTAPGELLPELFHGLPDAEDFHDPRPNRWFPQHDPARESKRHADPFTVPPAIVDSMSGESLNFLIGLSESEFGYIVPEEDFYFNAEDEGDHYEETVSLGSFAGTLTSETLRDLAEHPDEDRIAP